MLRIALRMLWGDRTKYLGVVMGVFLCTFLITHLLSMFSGMMARTYAMVTDIPEAQIWVSDPAVESVDEPAPMVDTALARVRGVAGVEWAVPLFARSLRARLGHGAVRAVQVIGVDDDTLLGLPRGLPADARAALRGQDAVVVDEGSAAGLLRVPTEAPTHVPGWNMPNLRTPTRPMAVGDEFLINDRRARVVALASLPPRFLSRPVVYTTYSRAVAMSPRERHAMAYVLARASAGEDPGAVAARIRAQTGLAARTAQGMAGDTHDYYVRTTGVVARIAFMIGIGVAVGVSVSALLLYLFTSENLPYYGLLAALGATRGVLVRMVLVQSVAASAVGLGLGVGASVALGISLDLPAMPFRITATNLAVTSATVLGVCLVSATLSASRVAGLEPGIVFRR